MMDEGNLKILNYILYLAINLNSDWEKNKQCFILKLFLKLNNIYNENVREVKSIKLFLGLTRLKILEPHKKLQNPFIHLNDNIKKKDY